ncbi:hypothetical protein BU055_02165 [Staphylococcus succinus]|uniref:hypothetical protein n=1 Tax=Staphylococcus succinus TaxID=61015 RepID=UPI000D1F08B6|nr:hypothetical protein [Staphylococcus succinus]PTJ85113.1 hypothetical protein BU055_02165 [Staphylococcus succinus]
MEDWIILFICIIIFVGGIKMLVTSAKDGGKKNPTKSDIKDEIKNGTSGEGCGCLIVVFGFFGILFMLYMIFGNY